MRQRTEEDNAESASRSALPSSSHLRPLWVRSSTSAAYSMFHKGQGFLAHCADRAAGLLREVKERVELQVEVEDFDGLLTD
jgi:hypothetical protein